MSLFKIFRGNKANLASQEKHDGYAWYTMDDAGFYIDAENGTTHQVERKKINDADNVSVDSESFASTNLKTILEGLNSGKVSDVEMSYDSNTETLTIQGTNS